MKYSNSKNLPLPIAVWLANDEYDHSSDPNTISATTLLKPIKQIVLARRLAAEGATKSGDISSLINSRMGTAYHAGIERAWTGNYQESLRSLGYTEQVIDKVRVNPETVTDDIIPVYLEMRTKKKIGKYTISGCFDFVAEGSLYDFKSTSTYTYINQTNDDYYRRQGSIYRWLNPELVTDDILRIIYIFTDWSSAGSYTNPSYPSSRILEQTYQLHSIAETDAFIKNKLSLVESLANVPEAQLPRCTPAELWQSPSKYKYYSDPTKLGRATKNFDTLQEANLHLASKGGKGIVIHQPGQVKACRYCPVFNACSQKDEYLADGTLTLD